MGVVRSGGWLSAWRQVGARLIVAFALPLLAVTLAPSPSMAQGLLPADFLSFIPEPGAGPARVEADMLSYDSRLDVISAEGGVVMQYSGYVIKADRLIYNQRTGELHAIGHVTMTDPGGNSVAMDEIEVTDGMKEAFLKSLTITTSDGAQVKASDVNYSSELKTILVEGAYSPCGLCVDQKGRRIGWQVKSARMIYDQQSGTVLLEEPSLELLGTRVAWLPWFWFSEPTKPRAQGIRMPSVDYSAKRGVSLTVPYFLPAGDDLDFLFSPTLMSRQGLLFAAEATQRFQGVGEITVKASGLYQLDPSAFAGTVSDRAWRGAIQTTGRFTPAPNWVAGWSYSAFTDNAYLKDYELADGDAAINQVYATYLDPDLFIDGRIQRFNRLGNFTAADDARQGMTLPWVRINDIVDLGPGNGRLNLSLDLLGVTRLADQADAITYGVPYVFGYEGNKVHVTGEAAWENQYILPGGVTATPYLGARVDASTYDGASSYPGSPPASTLFNVTPVAAMDFRWPLMAENGFDTHLLEPIAQIVYRGSSLTDTGITNDNAHSFVFDEANLFSYNRFSGTDRQETGLRANLGFHYLGNFANGGWIDAVAGQSFHLAGVNGLGIADETQAGASTGLGGTASHLVAGVRGGIGPIGVAGKIQLDTSFHARRAGFGVGYDAGGYKASLGYQFIAANPALGIAPDEHEITGDLAIPIADYWTANGGLDFDLAAGSWSAIRAGASYDDGYLVYGLNSTFTPSSFGLGLTFNLKGPGGEPAL
ncbi:MAG: LPS assembly protein LptD [Devosia sp.]